MEALLAPMEARRDPLRLFLSTYRRTTLTVRDKIARQEFTDSAWVERWDIAFANLYLDALEAWENGQRPPGPWAAAFGVTKEGPHLPPLRHLLLGMNAHINYDLPQSLSRSSPTMSLTTTSWWPGAPPTTRAWTRFLVDRVKPEDQELAKIEEPGDRTWLDRAMTPFNRAGTRRFLRESRRKVWLNAKLLSKARRHGPDALAARIVSSSSASRRPGSPIYAYPVRYCSSLAEGIRRAARRRDAAEIGTGGPAPSA